MRLCVLEPVDAIPAIGYARALLEGERLTRAESRILGSVARLLGREIIGEADPASADVLLHPHDPFLHPRAVRRSLEVAMNVRRPVALISGSDATGRSPSSWRTLWRPSGFASRLRNHERVATGEVPDLLEERPAGQQHFRPWTPRPTLGFIGHVASGLRAAAYLRHGWQHWYGFTLRERVLREFERSRLIETRFVRRSRNLGPPGTGVDADEERRRMRQEYVESVFGCDYSLCVRGAGNWSFRFFEALSAGRIPVLVDTDAVLPGEGSIEWERHLCRIPANGLSRAPELLAEFHDRIGSQGFRQMQAANRKLWAERLAPAPFLLHALRVTIRDAAPPGHG